MNSRDKFEETKLPPREQFYSHLKEEVSAKPTTRMLRRYGINSKSVSRSHILKNLKHKDYLHTLQTTKSSNATFRTITSQKHAVKTQEVNKLCLSAFDDKRYILSDGVSTLAHGHFRIPRLNAEAKEKLL